MRTLLRTEPTITKRSRVIKKGAPVEDYRIYCGKDATGKRVQFFRSTQAEAKQVAAEWGQKAKTLGDAALALTPAQTVDAAQAFRMLEGHTPSICLSTIVDKYLSCRPDPVKNIPALVLAYELYLSTFAPEQKRHVESVRSIVGRFVMKAASLGAKLSDVTRGEIERWISCTSCASSYNAHLSYLRAFFSWANKTYHTGNPCEGIARKRIAYTEPQFMRPTDVSRFMQAAEARPDAYFIIPRLVLGFFCGLRSAEIDRVLWRDIDLDSMEVRVRMPKGYTKGTKPRIVPLEPNAVAWLNKYGSRFENDAPISSFRYTRIAFIEIAAALGIRLDRNTMRHTYATMHVGFFRNLEATSCNMGHTGGARLLLAHYRGLVGANEAGMFWGILPTHKLGDNHELA